MKGRNKHDKVKEKFESFLSPFYFYSIFKKLLFIKILII